MTSISSSSDVAKPSLCPAPAMQPPASFSTIPTDLISEILGSLSPREQLACRPVCKKWAQVIQKIPSKAFRCLINYCKDPTQYMSAKQYLDDGLVSRYNKAMNLEPVVIKSTATEASFSNIQDKVLNPSSSNDFVYFPARMQNFFLAVQIDYRNTTTLYIDSYYQEHDLISKIKIEETPTDMRMEKIQFLLSDEILLARVAWNKPSDKSCKAVQVLMYHFEIGRCIVNTHSKMFLVHAKLLETLTEYELLDSLHVSLQNKGDKYSKILQIGAVNPTTKQKAILEYTLDVTARQDI